MDNQRFPNTPTAPASTNWPVVNNSNPKLALGINSGDNVINNALQAAVPWSVSYDSPETRILSMCVYNGKLYAGSSDSGIVYVFDGTTWSVSYDSHETYILSMCVYNGKLYAGSYSSGIVYVFDGTTWSISYDSPETIISSMCVYNGKLYAGSGTSGIVYVFDGTTWSVSYDSSEIYIRSVCVYNGKLYAGSGDSGIVYVFGELCQAIQPDMLSSSSISLGLNPSVSGINTGDQLLVTLGDSTQNTAWHQFATYTLTGALATCSDHFTVMTTSKCCLLEVMILMSLDGAGTAFGAPVFRVKDVYGTIGATSFAYTYMNSTKTLKLFMKDTTQYEPHFIVKRQTIQNTASIVYSNTNIGATLPSETGTATAIVS